LNGLIEGQEKAKPYEERVITDATRWGAPHRKQYGQGRAVYVPQVVYDGPLPEPEPYFTISNRFWKRPKNGEEIVEAIRWAANDDIPMQISGPEFLVTNLVEQPEKQRRLIHLINYNAPKVPEIPSVDVSCKAPNGKVVNGVMMYEVDSESPTSINFSAGSSAIAFTIPRVKTYAIVAIQW
jgi:hypothetical protein